MSSTLSEQVAELEAERDELKRQVEASERAERQATRVPRVITADELKPGQWIAVDNAGGWGAEQVDASWVGSLRSEMQTVNTRVVLLEDAPADVPEPAEPELPTELGSVILVKEWRGEKLDTPIYAAAGRDGDFWATSGRTFPDECSYAEPDEITGFRPARIVVEDGEA